MATNDLLDWFDQPIEVPKAAPAPNVNPCIALYGPGPGNSCRGCIHLRYLPYHDKKYWKCDLRKLTHGSGSDHKVGWPACGRYEQRKGEYHGG